MGVETSRVGDGVPDHSQLFLGGFEAAACSKEAVLQDGGHHGETVVPKRIVNANGPCNFVSDVGLGGDQVSQRHGNQDWHVASA